MSDEVVDGTIRVPELPKITTKVVAALWTGYLGDRIKSPLTSMDAVVMGGIVTAVAEAMRSGDISIDEKKVPAEDSEGERE